MDARGDRGVKLETQHDEEMGTKGLNEGQESVTAKTERGAERGLIKRGLGGRPRFLVSSPVYQLCINNLQVFKRPTRAARIKAKKRCNETPSPAMS